MKKVDLWIKIGGKRLKGEQKNLLLFVLPKESFLNSLTKEEVKRDALYAREMVLNLDSFVSL